MKAERYFTRLTLAALAFAASIPAFPQTQSSGFALEEVVVVAQRREENLQETPIAVSAFSEAALKDIGATTIKDLAESVPTLDISRTNQNAMQITLRGITSTNNTEIGDPAVSFNVDGIYMARPQAASALLFDTQRVEVLRGPQGTLFGRNSPAGAINVITRKPHFDGVDGSIGAVAGNYGRIGIQGTVNVPLSDTFAVRAAFMDERRDGFLEAGPGSLVPIADDEAGETIDDTAIRLAGLWTASDSVSWSLTYDYFDSGSVPNVMVLGTIPDPRVADLRAPSSADIESSSLRSRIDWDLNDNVRLSYLASLNTLDRQQNAAGVVGQNTVIVDSTNDSTTHEIQLQSLDTEKLEWIVGVFYFEEENFVDFRVDVNPNFGLWFLQPDRISESQAIFGQATYYLSDTLGLTFGARYSEDEKADNGGANFACPGGINPITNCTNQTADNTRASDWSAPTFRVQLDWNVTDETLFYASIANGYKAGGFAAGGSPEYDEETLVTYELGTKNDLLDGRLRLNAALYFSDFEDMQISSLESVPGGGTIRATRNAASATINGLEIEYTWLATDTSRFQGHVTFLDATFDDFTNAADDIFLPANQSVDASGNTLQNSPELSFSIAYDQDFNFSNGSTLRSRLAVSWRDEYWLRPINRPVDDYVGSSTLLDASLRYTAASEIWNVELFGKNLTDEEVRVELGGRGNGSGVPLYSYRPPRTYGVRFEYLFQ